MPNLKASKKGLRQSIKRGKRNDLVRSRLRKILKATSQIIHAGDKLLAGEYFKKATKSLDKAAKDKIIHPSKASRTKSQMAKKINNIAS